MRGATADIADRPTASPKPARLGEELPIFCERCGYSLHGLTQVRCERCEILQFICPECGHHQPINTLRPAVQRILGRVRVAGLIGVVFFKLNYFGWLLFAWFAMGVEWTYTYTSMGRNGYSLVPRPLSPEMWFCFTALAVPFAMVGRMLLLRFRRGVAVGIALAGLVLAAIVLGGLFRAYVDSSAVNVEPPWRSIDFLIILAWTGGAIVLSSAIVWPIWATLVRTFLPANLAKSLLAWQQSQSDRTASALARE